MRQIRLHILLTLILAFIPTIDPASESISQKENLLIDMSLRSGKVYLASISEESVSVVDLFANV
ncbi:MAG TPA: hypothetical protein PLZ55_01180, partial [bacterium]|nr:hypothetical protein [bacterium]